MAGFTQELSNPSTDISGSRPVQESTAGAIGGALSGLADIFQVGMKLYHEDRVSKAGLELENSLDTFAQAVQQGSMTSDEMLTRASSSVSSSINKNPDLADDLRSRAQKVLGLTPSSAIIKNAQDADEALKTHERNLQLGFVDYAAKRNLAVPNPDGSVNLKESAKIGQIESARDISIQHFRDGVDSDIAMENLNRLRNPQATPLTFGERQALAVAKFNREVVDGRVQTQLAVVKSGLLPWMDANKAIQEPQQFKAVQEAWGRKRFEILNQVEVDMANSTEPFDEKQKSDIRSNAMAQVSLYDNIFTGNFSTVQSGKDLFDLMDKKLSLSFQQQYPILAGVKQVGGPAVMSAILQPWLSSHATANLAANSEMAKFLGAIQGIGAKDGAVVSTPEEMAGAHSQLKAQEKLFGTLEPVAKTTWATTLGNALTQSNNETDPTQIRSAVASFSDASSIQTLKAFGKGPENEMQAKVVGRRMYSLNANNILRSGLQSRAATMPVGSSYGAMKTGAPLPGNIMAKAVFNPDTGQVEVVLKSDVPTRSVEGHQAPKEMQDQVRSINQSLNNLETLQEYAPDREKAMNIQELKTAIIAGANIPLKDGVIPASQKESAAKPSLDFANGFPSQSGMKALGLTKEEMRLYEHHINNLQGGGAVTNPDGSVSTVYNTTFEEDGKTYVIPTVWDGKVLKPREALARVEAEGGLNKWPSYPSETAAKTRYEGKIHSLLEKDTNPEEYNTANIQVVK